MEEITGYIFIGLFIGLIIILSLSDTERKEQRSKRLERQQGNNRLQQQRDSILNELSQKERQKTNAKNEAIVLLYHFAASKNNFTLKDLETATKQLQNHYLNNLKSDVSYKMNFPEKEMLNFEPKEILQFLIIINEGLHNATVHAASNFIFSIASIEDGKLNIITHDNGIGYSRKEVQDGNGIKTLLKAVTILKGNLKLTSTAGNGTVVNVEIPIT